eukprot:TRINITY_DN12455_c0_g1_i1.p2 TRINITY_DN12455_c0_g1~~TRINITY_DN12455_c0_g1_i1.p2  ORF type:complete len:112 (+),score=23.28 TRINITY_DN12455_c0_g1_i1:166-501(+)
MHKAHARAAVTRGAIGDANVTARAAPTAGCCSALPRRVPPRPPSSAPLLSTPALQSTPRAQILPHIAHEARQQMMRSAPSASAAAASAPFCVTPASAQYSSSGQPPPCTLR